MGYVPRTPEVTLLKREFEQLQAANNEITAELFQLKERERLGITDEGKLARNREVAEDYLWNSQQNLQTARSYVKRAVSITLISLPASVAFAVGAASFEHIALVLVLAVFAAVFGIVTVIGIGVIIGKIFVEVPEARRLVASNQRDLDRAVLKEMGL